MKKCFALLICFCMLFSSASATSGISTLDPSKSDTFLTPKMAELGVSAVILPSDSSPKLHFDSVEDVENFITALTDDDSYSFDSQENSSTSRSYTGTERYSDKWLVNDDLDPHQRNVDMKYTYRYSNGNQSIISVDEVATFIGGVDVYTWTQTMWTSSLTTKYAPNDTTKLKILGYYTLTTSVRPYNVGYTFSDDWNISITV